MYDTARRRLQRSVWSDPAVHAAELRRLFGSCWLCLAPLDRLGRPETVVATHMGDLAVLLYRQPQGALVAVVDRCPFCSESLSIREVGGSGRLTCPRHGDVDERAERVPRLESRGGLLLGCLDGEALPLADWLGPYLPWFDRAVAPGLVSEGTLPWSFAGNWKLGLQHGCDASAGERVIAAGPGVCTVRGETVTSMSVFPNLSLDVARGLLHVWHPIAPDLTQVETTGVSLPSASAAARATARRAALPAWSQETRWLAAAWESITTASAAPLAGRLPVPLLETEGGARAFYGWWSDRVQGANARTTRPDRLHLASR